MAKVVNNWPSSLLFCFCEYSCYLLRCYHSCSAKQWLRYRFEISKGFDCFALTIGNKYLDMYIYTKLDGEERERERERDRQRDRETDRETERHS